MPGDGGALRGIRILDLSRVLAGPSCTQMLADLGAEVIKVERPGVGDETRTWGPPYLKDADGNDTSEAAYYLCANRNKRSVTIDFSKPEGAALVRRLLAGADVFIENFKVGGLAKYGLGYGDLRDEFPDLVYCSISGFGQSGPYAQRPGYDMIAQGMGGLISMTGEPDRAPVKVPIAVNDIMTGYNAAVGILAALRHRDLGGGGQHIDVNLLDSQIGWLANQGANYLMSGENPKRLGTQHPNTVPYQAFKTADGHIILAANNDGQWQRFCDLAARPDLIDDPRFATNADRVRNRDACAAAIAAIVERKPSRYWIEALEKVNVSCCPVYELSDVFADPHVAARAMVVTMPHALSGTGTIDLIASPIRMSATPPTYRQAPPVLGQHTDEVLEQALGMGDEERAALRAAGLI